MQSIPVEMPEVNLLYQDELSLPLSDMPFLESFHRYQDDRCTTIGIKYVKRIIAVQGDLVELDGNELSINGKKLD